MPKRRTPDITEAESRLMDRLWHVAPQTAEQLAQALRHSTGWHHNTVRTLLTRLRDKGAIKATREGRRFLYAPLLTREVWQTRRSRRLLNEVFGGNMGSLLVHFSQHEQLDADAVDELRKLVARLEVRENRDD